jgi:hypothetical protein
MTTTRKDEAVLKYLKEHPNQTCSSLGASLWRHGYQGGRKPQAYARPAGKVLRRLERLGLVLYKYRKHGSFLWCLTEKGRVYVEALAGRMPK